MESQTKHLRGTHAWRAALFVVAIGWFLYLGVLHPWLMRWGATDTEVATALPGDSPESIPAQYFTRAITIRARRHVVWSWITQMGQDRAGFYSYTWLENLTTAGIHNASILHPEWQNRALGDRVRLARPDLLFGFGAKGFTTIVSLEPDTLIANIPGRLVLRSVDDGTTRLLVREPYGAQGPQIMRWLVWDPAHFVMVQRMMRGIKERAEGTPIVPPGIRLASRIGWLVAAAALMALFLSHRSWRPWILIPAALVGLIATKTSDWDAAMAGAMAIGVTIAGALAIGGRWWPYFLAIVSVVLLTLLLAPDAFTTFGLALGAGVTFAALVASPLHRALARHAKAVVR